MKKCLYYKSNKCLYYFRSKIFPTKNTRAEEAQEQAPEQAPEKTSRQAPKQAPKPNVFGTLKTKRKIFSLKLRGHFLHENKNAEKK